MPDAAPPKGPATALAAWLTQRSLFLLAAALLASIAAFALYYYMDRQVDTGATLVQRQTGQLEEAVRTDPGSFAARLALAKAYEGSGNYPGGIEQYTAALTIQPDQVEASLGLGRSQQASGDLAAASATFEGIVAARKDSEFAPMDNFLRDAYYYLGEIQLSQGDYQKAAESLAGALAIDSVDADAWWRTCEARLGAGELDAAVEACQHAVALVPNFTEAYQAMAQAQERAGNALQARYATAMASYSQGQFSPAVSELRAVVQDDASYWDAYVGLGLALEGQGDREGALAAYQQAATGDPENLLATMGVSRLSGAPPEATGE